MIDIEKVKNLLIKLDLKYKATKDQTNMNGIILLLNFDKEYKEFNTVNALDVLTKLENRRAITEKALELACEPLYDINFKLYNTEMDFKEYFKQQALTHQPEDKGE